MTRSNYLPQRRRGRMLVRMLLCILACLGLVIGRAPGCAGAPASVVAVAEEADLTAASETRTFTSIHGGTWMGVTSSWFGRYYADGIDDVEHLAYCTDYTRKGDVNSTSYSNPHAAGPGSSYILQHGYPFTTTIAGTTWSEGQARAITQIALWYYNNGYHSLDDNINSEARWTELQPIAYSLYEEGVTYAENGGESTGYGTVYTPLDPNVQTMMLATMPRLGAITIEKSSDNVAVTTDNPSYSLEGAAYGLWNSDGTDTGLSITLDASGQGSFSDVSAGDYLVHETAAPLGYVLDTAHGSRGVAADGSYNDSGWYPVTVTAGATVDVQVSDTPVMSIGTSAHDSETGDESSLADDSVTVVDAVSYESLVPGAEYVVSGELHLVATDGTDAGVIASAATTFSPAKASGNVDVTFSFDGSALSGRTVVAFETLTRDGVVVTTHADLTDRGQSISFPRIRTELADEKGYHEVFGDETITLVDTVSYENLKPGTDYVMTGRLVDSESGDEIVDEGGAPIVATAKFTPEKASGSIEVRFVLPASLVAGRKVVAFEDCSHEGKKVAIHADVHNEAQTVTVPMIHTMAHDATTGICVSSATSTASVIDTVSYEQLVPGEKYVITGELHLVDDGKDDGVVANATNVFTPETASGTADVTFSVDASHLGGRSLVAFETLAHDERTVATHADITDANQTIHVPSIGTELTGPDGGHSVVIGGTVTLTDTVTYSNLVSGASYTLRGTLVDKASGELLVDGDGTAITAETTFVPDTSDGTADVTFEVPGELVSPGREYVAFEECFYDENSIAVHADIDDAGQTVAFVTPEKGQVPATGDGGSAAALAFALTGAAAAAAGILLAWRKRNATSG